ARPDLLVVGVDLVRREAEVAVAVPDAVVEAHPQTALGVGVVRDRDHLDAVDEPLDHVAGDGRLDQISVLDPVPSAAELLQRGPVSDLPVPPDDLDVGVRRLQAPPEHLVPSAAMGRERASQTDLDLLVILLMLVSAEDPCLDLLILAPGAR